MLLAPPELASAVPVYQDSLYNMGMRPIGYSVRSVRDKEPGAGWQRCGEARGYYQTTYNSNPNPNPNPTRRLLLNLTLTLKTSSKPNPNPNPSSIPGSTLKKLF